MGTGVGEGVATGVDVVEGIDVGVGTGEEGMEVGVGVGGTGVAVGAGTGDGVGAGVASNSSITADMSSKEGDPSNFVPVLVGLLDMTNMVGVTETSFCRARLMSL